MKNPNRVKNRGALSEFCFLVGIAILALCAGFVIFGSTLASVTAWLIVGVALIGYAYALITR